MKYLARFVQWIQDLLKPKYKVRYVEVELPKELNNKTLYIIREDSVLENAAMVCPCGCGDVLYMSLFSNEDPSWKLTKHSNGTATLYPSILKIRGCESHFWLRRGRIYWSG